MQTSPITSIVSAWTSMTFEAQLAVMFFAVAVIFFTIMIASWLESDSRKRETRATKHRRSILSPRANSEKEDFFDMVTRFRSELDA